MQSAPTESLERTVVMEGQNGGLTCATRMHLNEDEWTAMTKNGVARQTRSRICNDVACPQDCVLSEWSDWSSCTAECGILNLGLIGVERLEQLYGGVWYSKFQNERNGSKSWI